MSARLAIVSLFGVIAVLVGVIVLMSTQHRDAVTSPPVAGSVPVKTTPSPSPMAGPWVEGQCLDTGVPPDGLVPAAGSLRPAECGVTGALSQIVRLVPVGEGLALCPARTDGIVDPPAGSLQSRTACLRNLTGSHPGDKGAGGGVLRQGDCVYVGDDEKVQERPCADSGGPGRIWGLYRKKSQCKDAQGFLDWHYAHRRDHPALPIVCAGPGDTARELGAEYPNGTCFTEPPTLSTELGDLTFGDLTEVACGDENAWARVVTTVDVRRACPARATTSVTDDDYYPAKTCLRTLR